MAGQTQTLSSLMQMYNTFKAQEAKFPVPKTAATITVGTLSLVTGQFQYAVDTYTKDDVIPPDPKPGGNPKPITIHVIGGRLTAMNVYNLTLRFEVTGGTGEITASVAGRPPVHATVGNAVEIPVGTDESAVFTISCGGKSYSSEAPLLIERPIAGAGAMTLPALPVAVIYAPPVDEQKKNVASWTTSDSAGNTTTVSFSQQNSKGQPINSEFQDWSDMASALKTSSDVLSKIPTPYTQAAGVALGLLSGMMGSSSATETKGTTVTQQNTLTLTLGATNTVATTPTAGGPGQGDIVYFLKNARVCWFSDGGRMKLALLGWDSDEVLTVAFLQQNGKSHGLDDDTIKALLKLDPFVAGGVKAKLSAPRFVLVETIEINGATVTRNLNYTLTDSNMKQTVDTVVDVENDSEGMLSFLGIGVPKTQTLQSTMTQSSLKQKTGTHTVSKQMQLNGAGDEYYSVEVYCDVVFGTFAFRPVPGSKAPRVTGVAVDANGKPMASQTVTLTSDGNTFTAVTDASGKFAFRASTIAAGTIQVAAGSANKQVTLAADAPVDVQLKP